MAVRKTINRYKTEPFGHEYKEVLKRGKAFHKDGSFMMVEYKSVWTAASLPAWGKLPDGARVYEKVSGRWIERTA